MHVIFRSSIYEITDLSSIYLLKINFPVGSRQWALFLNLSKFLRMHEWPWYPLALFALDSSFLSPTSDGGAAAIVCSEEFVRRNFWKIKLWKSLLWIWLQIQKGLLKRRVWSKWYVFRGSPSTLSNVNDRAFLRK